MRAALRHKPKPLDSARELWTKADCIGLDSVDRLTAIEIAERDYLHHRAVGELIEAVSELQHQVNGR